mmetsp:Transcript_21218/g.29191  ORF Transcript_21218/g.29191 Transcript_21218/m.29191 type:complete len:993 (+) Transcript_21218:16-2994(+)
MEESVTKNETKISRMDNELLCQDGSKSYQLHDTSFHDEEVNPLAIFPLSPTKQNSSCIHSHSFAKKSFNRVSFNDAIIGGEENIQKSIETATKTFVEESDTSTHLSKANSVLSELGSLNIYYNSSDEEAHSKVVDNLDLAMPRTVMHSVSTSRPQSFTLQQFNDTSITDNIRRSNQIPENNLNMKEMHSITKFSTSIDPADNSGSDSVSTLSKKRRTTLRSFSVSVTNSSSMQTTAARMKEIVEDASLRASSTVDSELERIRQVEMNQLMRAASALAMSSTPKTSDEEEECVGVIDETGRAKGFGFRSIKAGLKKTDVRAHKKVPPVAEAKEGSTAVRPLSMVTSPQSNNNIYAAAAAAAVAAVTESPMKKYPFSKLQTHEEMDSKTQETLTTNSLEDLQHENKHSVANPSSPNAAFPVRHPTMTRSASSSSLFSLSNNAASMSDIVHSSISVIAATGNEPNSVIISPKLSRRNTAPMHSMPLNNVAAEMASESKSSHSSIAPKLHHSSLTLPDLPMSDLLQVIRSESFIESSGYSWAKVMSTSEAAPEKLSGSNDSFLMAASNQTSESFREKESKKKKKKKFVVTVNMSSSLVNSKGSLLEAGKFVQNIQHEIQINNSLAKIRNKNNSDPSAEVWSLDICPQSEDFAAEIHKDPFNSIDDTFLLTAPPSSAVENLPKKLDVADTLKSASKLLSARNPDKIRKAGSSRFRIVSLLKDKPPDYNPSRSEVDDFQSNTCSMTNSDSGTMPLKNKLLSITNGMSLDAGASGINNSITLSEIMCSHDGREMTWSGVSRAISSSRCSSNDSRGSVASSSPKSPSHSSNHHSIHHHHHSLGPKVSNPPLTSSSSFLNKEKAKLTVIQEASLHSCGSNSSHPATPQVVSTAGSPKRLKNKQVNNQLEDTLAPLDHIFDRNDFPDSKHNYSDMNSSHSKSNHKSNNSFEKLLSPESHKIISSPATKRSLRPVSAGNKRMPLLLHVVDMADFRAMAKNSIV